MNAKGEEGMDTRPQLGDNELKVLRAVRKSAMDGYSLLSTTGLDAQGLVDTLSKLQNVISIKGELLKERVGEAYVALPPSNRGWVDMILSST
jgi:hypothetical protein